MVLAEARSPKPKMGGTYKDLEAWQASMELVVEVYRVTVSFPREEIFGLTSQMRRAAVSVASNIAEGKVVSPIASWASSWE
jgi:hypothetical protein